ncbi:flagellar biosynthesis protein FlhB [Sphingomonas sp. PR090111-T3T-6A]|uniref:flagellar biosynthesis protein FlhB n=1 Tax=Sphingomonas sp. PR090111-T3T-6A TaxID=685778 RepID=UPI000379DB54|nr:flagellar biosynthesis protein FlhB [Sphingomonas sp. PR090111-T3T-6A]
MADTDQDQKTEEPTAKRLEDARKRGQVPIASEVRHATMFVGMMIVAGGMGAWTLARLGAMFVRLWGSAEDYALDPLGAQDLATGIAGQFALAVAPLAAVLVGCALSTIFIQGRPTLSWSRLAPQWSKLSPMTGLGRLLGQRALVEFAKTLAKFLAIAVASLLLLWPRVIALDQMIGAGPDMIASATAELAYRLLKTVGLMVIALALADFLYQRRAFLNRMRMTKQEVKDEHKQNEGDPKIKGRIRAIRMQRARRRMMAAVPDASVVITNPTHYAVALHYEHGVSAAPKVVAKGTDMVALRIREIATEAGVPIVESPPLARALFATVEIDHPIPVEHYAAVAEVISYVMRQARRSR